MDSTNMEVSDNDPAAMTDVQLREELRLLGFHTGPITGGTRVVYELKLRRMRKGSTGAEADEAEETDEADEAIGSGGKRMTVDFESTPPMAPSNDEAIGGGIKRVTVDFESPPELPGNNEDYVHEESSRDVTPKSHQKRGTSLPSSVLRSARRPVIVLAPGVSSAQAVREEEQQVMEQRSSARKLAVNNKRTLYALAAFIMAVMLVLYIYFRLLR